VSGRKASRESFGCARSRMKPSAYSARWMPEPEQLAQAQSSCLRRGEPRGRLMFPLQKLLRGRTCPAETGAQTRDQDGSERPVSRREMDKRRSGGGVSEHVSRSKYPLLRSSPTGAKPERRLIEVIKNS
jgi:hypothetical protein